HRGAIGRAVSARHPDACLDAGGCGSRDARWRRLRRHGAPRQAPAGRLVSAAAGAVPPAPPVRDLGKRVFETALTVASLPLVLPLAAACAVAIAVDTPGPI